MFACLNPLSCLAACGYVLCAPPAFFPFVFALEQFQKVLSRFFFCFLFWCLVVAVVGVGADAVVVVFIVAGFFM